MKLTAIVHKDESGGYWAEVPALPGCATEGETLAELRANLRDAIRGCLEARGAAAAAAHPAKGELIEVAV